MDLRAISVDDEIAGECYMMDYSACSIALREFPELDNKKIFL
jgi:hypothetical protein